MYDESTGHGGAIGERARVDVETESPLPDVPFMGIAAVLGLLVLVLIAAAAWSISTTVGTISLDSMLWAPAIFMLLVAGVFYLIDRFQPRTYDR
jgi:steroid 5-alpha reductase family enzyme